MNTNAITRELERLAPGAVQCNVPLDKYSQWKIGGLADIVVCPRDANELARIRAWIHERDLRSITVGATSNLLFSDDGLRAIAIHVGAHFDRVEVDRNSVMVETGVWMPGLARRAMQAGLRGLEHTCGIPGTVGGLICMNGGSQRKGVGDVVMYVESINGVGEVIRRTKSECDFGYRRSIFQSNDDVIVRAALKLEVEDDPRKIRRQMLSILRDRRSKFPRKQPNCGSVFVSNPAMYEDYGPPGRIIEESGFKGFRVGNAAVSNLHANFIVNEGGATASDVLSIIETIRRKVVERTGYFMQVEVRFVSPVGEIQSI